MPINQIIQGDALEILKTFPDDCVDLVITSPPYYSLRNYGVEGQIGLEETFNEYLDKILKITAELKRVLKKTGQLWWNHGDSFNDKCFFLQPERLVINMTDKQGWILRNKIVCAKQILLKKENKIIGSAMPTSIKDRFNETWEYLYFFVKNKKYYSNLDEVRLPFQVTGVTDLRLKAYKGKFLNVKNPEAFNSPSARALRKSLEERMNDTKDKNTKQSRAYNVKKLLSEIRVGKKDYFSIGKNLPSVWQINPEPHNFQKELGVETDHFAAFPKALCEIPIKFGCPEDGIVLDPFAGSGTALVVAKSLGRKYIGIELNPDYVEIAKKRLELIPDRLL